MVDTPTDKLLAPAGWRHALGWTYLIVVVADFVLFPILWTVAQVYAHVTPLTPWQPITLQAGGLFHVTVCAVMGVHLWRRFGPNAAGNNPQS